MKHYALIGGNSGIGYATVESLLAEGNRVSVYVRNTQSLQSLSREISIYDWDLDSTGELDFPDMLDGLVYFPGTINLKPFKRLKKDDWLNDYRVNVVGAAEVIQKALPSLKKSESASVVLFSSVAATTGMNFHASIAAAKAGVEGMAKSLAAEFAPEIRFNVISPSLTDTPLAGQLLSNDGKRKASADRHPLKAIGQPQDMAKMVSLLLSEHSKFMTGQVIGMDGGMSQTRPL